MTPTSTSAPPRDAAGERLLATWRRLSRLPAGGWLFDRALARMVPYTGALGAHVELLEPGRARVSLRDRRAVRNHLSSVHAVALVNLGELATGLALVTALPPERRGIVVALEAVYHKKARGTLVAEAHVPGAPAVGAHVVEAPILDAAGDEVARVTARWQVGERGGR